MARKKNPIKLNLIQLHVYLINLMNTFYGCVQENCCLPLRAEKIIYKILISFDISF